MKRDKRTRVVRIIQIVTAIAAFGLTFTLAGEPKIAWAGLSALIAVVAVWVINCIVLGVGYFFDDIRDAEQDAMHQAAVRSLGE